MSMTKEFDAKELAMLRAAFKNYRSLLVRNMNANDGAIAEAYATQVKELDKLSAKVL